MNRIVVQSGPIAGVVALLLFVLVVAVLGAGIIFGVLAFMAISLVALAVRVLGGLSPRRSVRRRVDTESGRIIDGSYRVLNEGPARSPDESGRSRSKHSR